MIIAVDFDDTLSDGSTGQPVDLYAFEVINRWLKAGHSVYVLTGRHEPHDLKNARDFLVRYGTAIEVVSIGCYDMKLKLGYKWDVLIDDSNELWREHEYRADPRPLIHMHHVYSEESEHEPYHLQATNWSDVETMVGDFLK